MFLCGCQNKALLPSEADQERGVTGAQTKRKPAAYGTLTVPEAAWGKYMSLAALTTQGGATVEW